MSMAASISRRHGNAYRKVTQKIAITVTDAVKSLLYYNVWGARGSKCMGDARGRGMMWRAMTVCRLITGAPYSLARMLIGG